MPKPRRKTDEQLATDMARSLLPASQATKRTFVLVDVQNHSEADQRHMKRSGQVRTIRRLTRIEKLERRGVIDKREGAACEWYATAHAARYDTCGITANYGESSGAANTNFDHLPKTKLQWDALTHYDMARQAIPPMVRPMFERIVLEGRPLGKLAITFRNAARRLLAHIEGKVAL